MGCSHPGGCPNDWVPDNTWAVNAAGQLETKEGVAVRDSPRTPPFNLFRPESPASFRYRPPSPWHQPTPAILVRNAQDDDDMYRLLPNTQHGGRRQHNRNITILMPPPSPRDAPFPAGPPPLEPQSPDDAHRTQYVLPFTDTPVLVMADPPESDSLVSPTWRRAPRPRPVHQTRRDAPPTPSVVANAGPRTSTARDSFIRRREMRKTELMALQAAHQAQRVRRSPPPATSHTLSPIQSSHARDPSHRISFDQNVPFPTMLFGDVS